MILSFLAELDIPSISP